VMQSYWRSLDRLDELLDREGILTGLTYVPVRIRPSAQPREQTATAGDGTADVAARGAAASTRGGSGQGRAVFRASDPQRPHTGWAGEPIEELDEDEQRASEQLQQLLDSRRDLLGKLRPGRKVTPGAVMATDEVFSSLGHLQVQPLSVAGRSEEHTSELQSRENLVCRLLLEKKKEYISTLNETRPHA